jgi:hypothetical protein
MENIVNQPFLTKRAKYAKWGSYVGFGALFVGLVTGMRSPLSSYAFLMVGLLGASIGSYLSNRYVKEPRPDQSLALALEELDKRYALYNYYLSSQHVVASHFGLTVLEPRAQRGEIRVSKGHWRHKGGARKLLQLLGEPGLGRPDGDLERGVHDVKEWIAKLMPDDEIPVSGVIVFTNPKAKLLVEDAATPVTSAEELAQYLKEGLKGGAVLSTAKQKELRRALDEVVAQA